MSDRLAALAYPAPRVRCIRLAGIGGLAGLTDDELQRITEIVRQAEAEQEASRQAYDNAVDGQA